MGILRSAFLVDEKGKVAEAWYKISPKDTTRTCCGRSADERPATAGGWSCRTGRPVPVRRRGPTAIVPGESAYGPAAADGGTSGFFTGHFPGRPTLPGVLMCEGDRSRSATPGSPTLRFAGKLPLFGGLDGARFRRQVGPGDEAGPWRSRSASGQLGRARQGVRDGRCSATMSPAPSSHLLFVEVGLEVLPSAGAPDADSPTLRRLPTLACVRRGSGASAEPLWPPKPKLLDIVGPGSQSRASPVTTSMPRSTTLVFAVGGIWR